MIKSIEGDKPIPLDPDLCFSLECVAWAKYEVNDRPACGRHITNLIDLEILRRGGPVTVNYKRTRERSDV